MNRLQNIISVFLLTATSISAHAQEKLSLSNGTVSIGWEKQSEGWTVNRFDAASANGHKGFGTLCGRYGLIYSAEKPAQEPVGIIENGSVLDFPEDTFKYVKPDFLRATSAVPMNTAGEYITFLPHAGYMDGDAVVFETVTPYGKYRASWRLDERFPGDILVDISFTAEADGYYSLPSPTPAYLGEEDLSWAVVPGFYQGNSVQKSFPLAYAYAQGLPEYPVVCRESTITTMASLMAAKNGITMAVIPEAGQDRNPYDSNEQTHIKLWNIGLSHMNRDRQLTPMAYHPVLGENGSYLRKGDTAEFRTRITLQESDWYTVYKHAIYDIYKLEHSFALKENSRSLTDRLFAQYDYVLDDATAMWHEEEYKGRRIIAQSYMSGVAGADNDAMKNSDIGAVWMLGRITGDRKFNETRIPYIRNFKTLQQSREGFFKGAAEGQYYLAKSKRFTEEWGNHFEPVAVTYYTMADLGNILLFEPDNNEIRKFLKNGADLLLRWQHTDGSWVVAYDRTTHEPIYTDLQDLRPTFYGLVIAYRMLGNKKYLDAALKGADWLIENGVDKGHFTGVCGDVRFVNDFATIQCSGALLDLYEITGEKKYMDAAVKTARMYTTSIYTHPIPTRELKEIDGRKVEDWQLSQVGLGFEHGGSMGSAVKAGPILLASHCSFFLKLYSLTGDKLFRDLARLGANGKDAFVNRNTGVASYYWVNFDRGAGPFPHHAWWQIGWIYDYILAEAELRSAGRVSFPRGFMTPKVGTHRTAGFAPGTIDGQRASLVLRKGLVQLDNPNMEYISAVSDDGKTLFVVLLNSRSTPAGSSFSVDRSGIGGNAIPFSGKVELEPFGCEIISIAINT